LSFLSILLLVVHFPNSDHSDPVACDAFVEENVGLCGGAAESPPQNGNRKLSVITTKWQSKTVELQNFISEQASHHFVFCHRKLDWQRVESAQILRMMMMRRRTMMMMIHGIWETSVDTVA